MLISSAPLRISLAGGGTDLPSYARLHEGVVLGAAIDRRVAVVASTSRTTAATRGAARACLDQCCRTADLPAVANPYARAALERYWDRNPLEIASMGDVPPGTGMGSSAAFCVAMVGALSPRSVTTPVQLAEAAAQIEMGALGRPVGGQDHYLSALGGFRLMRFRRDGSTEVESVEVSARTRARLDKELMLFYSGITRDAAAILAAQDSHSRAENGDVLERLHGIKALTTDMLQALTSGDCDAVGSILHTHWELKQGLSSKVSLSRIDTFYAEARAAGATGGKLLGAGGGGYVLLHVPEAGQADVRALAQAHSFIEEPFRFELAGHRISEP